MTQQTILVEIMKSAASGPKTLSVALSDPTGGATISAPSTASLTVDAASTASGLVAAYSFDETSGPTVVDLSGNNNAGTLQGATTRSAKGRFGAALSFDGTSSRVIINNSPSLMLSSGMTLEAWVYPTTSTARWQDIIFKDTDAYYLESNSPRNAPGTGGTFISTPTYGKSPIPVNTWTHLAATYDQQVLRLYVNGVEVANQPRTTPLAGSTKPLYLGGDPTSASISGADRPGSGVQPSASAGRDPAEHEPAAVGHGGRGGFGPPFSAWQGALVEAVGIEPTQAMFMLFSGVPGWACLAGQSSHLQPDLIRWCSLSFHHGSACSVSRVLTRHEKRSSFERRC